MAGQHQTTIDFRFKNRIFTLSLLLSALLGVFLGYRLSGVPILQPYKLLNISGLIYNLLGVFVLSEVLVSDANWKRICVELIAPILLWAQSTVPCGAFIGAWAAWFFSHGPSASIVVKFAFLNFFYISFVGMVLEGTVVLPRLFKISLESRWRNFGLILLASGMLFQLIAAIWSLR